MIVPSKSRMKAIWEDVWLIVVLNGARHMGVRAAKRRTEMLKHLTVVCGDAIDGSTPNMGVNISLSVVR